MTKFWLGSQESYDIVVAAKIAVAEAKKAGRYSNDPSASEFPPLWTRDGSTATISVDGSLIDGNAGWMRYYGVLGYDDIAQAAVEAYSHPDVKSVLWHINSGGGHVNGISDMGALAGQLSGMKNSAAFTSNVMASAAYWLGSSVKGPLLASQTAEVGSIGVLVVHREYSKQLQQNGVTVSVLRSGADKALSNPYEPLTADAKAEIESQLADVHDIFKAAVGKNRPEMSAEDLRQATTGKTYLGKRAVAAGLVDKVSSFDMALKLLDKQSGKSDTPSNSKAGAKMKVTLTQEQVAAISAGATPASLGFSAEQIADLDAQNAAAAEAERLAAEAETARVAALAAANPAPVVPAPASAGDVVALLQSQLVTAQASLVTSQAELINERASNQTIKATQDGLLRIARAAINKMAIALGTSGNVADTLDATAAIAQYDASEATFNAKFRVGGVAAPTKVEKAEGLDPAFLHAAQNAPTSRK